MCLCCCFHCNNSGISHCAGRVSRVKIPGNSKSRCVGAILYSGLTPGSAWFSGSQSKALPCASETEHKCVIAEAMLLCSHPSGSIQERDRNMWKQLKCCLSNYTHWIKRGVSLLGRQLRTVFRAVHHCSSLGILSQTLRSLSRVSNRYMLSPLHHLAPWPYLSSKHCFQRRHFDKLGDTNTNLPQAAP